MKLLSLIVGTISALVWGGCLHANIARLDFVACVMLPESPIDGQIWFNVVFPTAMLTLSVAALISNIFISRPARWIRWTPFITLALILVYFAGVTGLSVTEAAARECRR